MMQNVKIEGLHVDEQMRVHGDMTATFELTHAEFAKFKQSQDELAEAWRAFAREVVRAEPMPHNWKPTPSPVQLACRAVFVK
ncbi:MAG: hypothetical protein JWR85_4212 [Marmoricola sp.]|jgi:hypothetical protein|nr:hypothetical protein [Marmoricola sp.]